LAAVLIRSAAQGMKRGVGEALLETPRAGIVIVEHIRQQ